MELTNVFSSFLITDFLSDIDNIELKRYALDLREKHPGVIKSNFIGWQSNILEIPNPEISKLVSGILQRADFFKEKLGFKKDYYFYLNNLWININQKSSFNRPHIHPDSLLAGVYYVDCNENQGKLVFQNPSMVQQCAMHENFISNYTEFNSSTWSILPEIGKLLIFPSWLEHYVEPNASDEERISIAFNINIQKDQNE